MRHELVDLMTMLVQECKNRGYRFGTPVTRRTAAGGLCRAITGSNNPSNHSWGLAVDINAPSNPYTSALVTDMPGLDAGPVGRLRIPVGRGLLGTKDAMHYEFMGSVTDAANETAKARKNGLGGGGGSKPPPDDWWDELDEATLRRIVGEEIEQHIASLWNTPMVAGRPPSGLTLQLVADRSEGDSLALTQVGRTVWDTAMVPDRPPSGMSLQLMADRSEEAFNDINEIQAAVVPGKQ